MVGSLTRPVKELKSFHKVELNPGESRLVTFTFSKEDFSFYGPDKTWITESGEFKVWVAKDAHDVSNELSFTLK